MVVGISACLAPAGPLDFDDRAEFRSAFSGELGYALRRLGGVWPCSAYRGDGQVAGGAQPQPALEQGADLEIGQRLQQRGRRLGQPVGAELLMIDGEVGGDRSGGVLDPVV